MNKAFEIKEKAVKDLLLHAKFEIRNIIDHLIRLGEMDENPDEEYYEIDTFGYNVPDSNIEVLVTNTYDDDVYPESRTISGFIDHDGVVSVRTKEDEDDEISLRSLPFDSIVVAVSTLEDMWTNLIKPKKDQE